MTEILYISVISSAKVSAVISFIAGVIFSVIFTVPAAIYSQNTYFTDYSIISGTDILISLLTEMIIFTILISFFGCIICTAFSFIYNQIAPVIGGFEIDLIDEEIYIEEIAEEDPIGYE